jgi:O-antigen/teichoic acid export membrane protein
MTPDEGQNYDNLRHSMARGAVWMIGMRWTIRAIGLLNTVILARLLTPADFGIVAMASVAASLLDSLADFNAETSLVRSLVVGRGRYDSAWTVQVIEGLVKTALLVSIAPLLAGYYGDPRVELVLYIIALRPGIEGFENIGQVDFRRELQFDKEFRYWVYRRLLAFLLSIGIALWMRNYLALAIAAPITGIATVVLSYVMSSYRPQFALSHVGEIWAFSKWWILFGLVRFFGSQGEEFILGGLTTPKIVGAYAVGNSFSGLLTSEAILPTARAFMPTYAKMSDNPTQLLTAFQLSFGVLVTISLAMGIGASLVAADIVVVILGAQWRSAIPFFQWLAVSSAFWCIVQSMMPYFYVTNRERLFALCNLGYLAILIPALLMAVHISGVETVALSIARTRTAVTALFMIAMFGVLLVLGVFSLGKLVDLLWRPLVACGVMATFVLSMDLGVGMSQIVSLVIHVAIGVAVFFTTLVFLWAISGRPSGAEAAIFSLTSDYMRIGRRQ